MFLYLGEMAKPPHVNRACNTSAKYLNVFKDFAILLMEHCHEVLCDREHWSASLENDSIVPCNQLRLLAES